MSQEAVQEIVRKAVTDEEFREELFVAPEKAVANYDLTEEEFAALQELSPEDIEELTLEELDERLSKAVAGDGGWLW